MIIVIETEQTEKTFFLCRCQNMNRSTRVRNFCYLFAFFVHDKLLIIVKRTLHTFPPLKTHFQGK